MSELFKRYAFVLLAARALFDLTLAVIIYQQVGNLAPSVGLMLICGVFYVFLYFGIRNEEFPGRYGRRVTLRREPVAYWFCIAVLVLFHLIITGRVMVSVVHW
jgi:hypothetical protein